MVALRCDKKDKTWRYSVGLLIYFTSAAETKLGRTVGLPHPPGRDAGASTCDYNALRRLGYLTYPVIYLRDDGYFQIRNKNSAMCLTSPGTSDWDYLRQELGSVTSGQSWKIQR